MKTLLYKYKDDPLKYIRCYNNTSTPFSFTYTI